METTETDLDILGETLAIALRRYKHLKTRGLTLDEIRFLTDGEPREGLQHLLLRSQTVLLTNGVETADAPTPTS